MGYGYRVADGARTVMCEPYEHLTPFGEYERESEARLDYDDAWQDLTHTILACLSPAWFVPDDDAWRFGHPAGRVIAWSGLHELLLDECQGGYGYAYVTVWPLEVLEPGEAAHTLAKNTLDRTADAIFTRLSGHYELFVPGGYIASPYRPAA
jgi:hypothetical protein